MALSGLRPGDDTLFDDADQPGQEERRDRHDDDSGHGRAHLEVGRLVLHEVAKAVARQEEFDDDRADERPGDQAIWAVFPKRSPLPSKISALIEFLRINVPGPLGNQAD